jgi:hypothetical protein
VKTAAITGANGSGKTTLWTALVGGVGTKGDTGIVEVPDARVDHLAELHSSKKKTYSQLAVVDAHQPTRTFPQSIAKLREADALIVCVGVFAGEDPEKGLSAWIDELILADLAPIESSLDRLVKEKDAKAAVATLKKAREILESGKGLSEVAWGSDELDHLSSISPLTIKPRIAVMNIDESQMEDPVPAGAVAIPASIENEVAGMSESDAKELLASFGIEERGADQLIRELYGSLDLITFLTIGERESRAWEIRKGAKAPEAAGSVHSDMERGFIRAEVCDIQTIEAEGNWDAAKANGKLRVEGKDYVIKEGDVVLFRFAV